MSAAFAKFGLDQNTIDFIGHALALHRDDEYGPSASGAIHVHA